MEPAFLGNLREKMCNCSRNSTISVIYDAFSEWLRLHRREFAGKALPPVNRVSRALGVARQTVRKVYLRLETEHLIVRRQHERNWFVTPLKRSGPQNIALILPTMFSDYYLPSTEYGQRHFGIYSGIADRAMERGYALIPYQLPPPDASRQEIVASVEELVRNYAGVIHLGGRQFETDPPLAELVARNDLPQMSIDCDFGLPWIGVVSFDFQQVAHTVASFLRENGHRRIGIVYPLRTEPERVPEFHYMMNDRATVLEPFLREPMRFDRIFEIVSERHQFGEPFREQIREAMEDPEPPTAFWCRDDISAMELIRVLRSFHCAVPEDFSVIGFDDLSAAESFDPPLTTLRNPVYELGYQAMYLLDHYIMQGVDSIAHITRLAPVLCVRKSVGARKISPAGGLWQHNI